MTVYRGTLIVGISLLVGFGCASPSNLAGVDRNSENSIVTATSSKYKFLHVEWGSNDIGFLAHQNGIRYVLGDNHHKTGIPFLFSKKRVTIYGFPNEEAFQEWKAKRENAEQQAIVAALLEREKAEQQAMDLALQMMAQQAQARP